MSRIGQIPRLLLVVALAGIAAVLNAASASAAVYWTDVRGVGGVNLDGSAVNPMLFTPTSGLSSVVCGLALTDSDLFWGGYSGVWRVNRDGPAVPAETVAGAQSRCGLAVNASDVYWTDWGKGTVGRAALDGTVRADALIPLLDDPCDLAITGENVYWSDDHGIGRARLDGMEAEPGFVSVPQPRCALAADSEHLYWDGNGEIGRARLDGTELEPAFISGLGTVTAIAVFGGVVYWSERGEGTGLAAIGRAVPGVPPESGWTPTGVHEVRSIAVDGKTLIERRSLPSRTVRFGQLRPNLRRGTAVLDVWVPARGELELVSPKIGWRVAKGPEPPPWRDGLFRRRLKLWPGKKGKVSKNVRRLLDRRGRAPLVMRVAYSEVGRLPVRKAKRLVLRKRLRKAKRSVARHGHRSVRG
jgi:hypothetical protein